MVPAISTLLLLVLFFSLAVATSSPLESAPAKLARRDEKVPFLDYSAIKDAASAAILDDLRRRGPSDDVLEKRTHSQQCDRIWVRKEWRTLTRTQKKNYITAVKCLRTKSDFGISPVSDKLYDAFTYIHGNNWIAFHGCAPFAPWHRWFVWLREVTMKEVCGYDGPFPYWNYTMDYQNPFSSPIFSTDTEIGFGTHGTVPVLDIVGATGYKVDNGAFANLRVSLPEPHYLARNFSFWKDTDPTGLCGVAFGETFGPEQLKKNLAASTFWEFETIMDGLNTTSLLGIHNSPHFNSNGDWTGPNWLINTSYYPFANAAPNDPMFFPHHAYVDAVFWKWQQAPGHQRLYGGSNNISDRTLNDAKRTDILPFSGFGPDVPVALVLKTENYPLCYTYDF